MTLPSGDKIFQDWLHLILPFPIFPDLDNNLTVKDLPFFKTTFKMSSFFKWLCDFFGAGCETVDDEGALMSKSPERFVEDVLGSRLLCLIVRSSETWDKEVESEMVELSTVFLNYCLSIEGKKQDLVYVQIGIL